MMIELVSFGDLEERKVNHFCYFSTIYNAYSTFTNDIVIVFELQLFSASPVNCCFVDDLLKYRNITVRCRGCRVNIRIVEVARLSFSRVLPQLEE